MTLLFKAKTLVLKNVKSEQYVCDYFSRHLYKDLLKFKELIHYVNFAADDATLNALTIDIVKKATKNNKLSHQVIKLARQNNLHKINESFTFLRYTESRNTFKHFLKTDSELTVDDNLALKSSQIVIPRDLQNHVIPLAHQGYLGTIKTKGLHRTKGYFPKLDNELVEKLLAKCVTCKVVRKNTNIQL